MAAISARLRAPDGCPWDRRQDHRSLRPVPARGGVRDARRDRARNAGRPGRGAGRPVPPGHPPCPARGRGGRVRPDRRLSHPGNQDRAPPSPRLRRRGGQRGRRGDHATGRRSSPPNGRMPGGPHRVLRRRRAHPAGPACQPRDPGTGLGPGLGLAGHRRRLGEGRRGARRAARGVRRAGAAERAPRAGRRPVRAGQPRPLDEAWIPRRRCASRTGAGSSATGRSRRWPPNAASILAALDADAKDALWNEVKAR